MPHPQRKRAGHPAGQATALQWAGADRRPARGRAPRRRQPGLVRPHRHPAGHDGAARGGALPAGPRQGRGCSAPDRPPVLRHRGQQLASTAPWPSIVAAPDSALPHPLPRPWPSH